MRNPFKHDFFYIAMAVIIIVMAFCTGLYLKSLNVNLQFHKGSLAVYDVYDNLKYVFEGNFRQVDSNTFYDKDSNTYYTFENSILTEEVS